MKQCRFQQLWSLIFSGKFHSSLVDLVQSFVTVTCFPVKKVKTLVINSFCPQVGDASCDCMPLKSALLLRQNTSKCGFNSFQKVFPAPWSVFLWAAPAKLSLNDSKWILAAGTQEVIREPSYSSMGSMDNVLLQKTQFPFPILLTLSFCCNVSVITPLLCPS